MLVLSRFPHESVQIGDDIRVTIVDILGAKIRIGIDAPRGVRILRTELLESECSGDSGELRNS
jgi:carbon storage regulator